ncbi:MAG: hypothetical protein O9267_13860 [Flavobacterium sp.]|uniref:hypothetical protein n=1 Tax=Flavobacterium sp. TaxID=239 RepID=UPI0022C30AD8|nr:hypothetical protein [Flavobacterium sp.]MCZ8198685.1 hypothetical protein [Flavobacterium sp.]
MIKKLVTIVLIFSLTSCATIFTKKTYKLEIKSFANTKVKVYDSIYNLPAKIEVKRSKNVLPIVLISDTIKKNYSLKPSINPKYLYGNLSFVHFAPIGYLVDLTNGKRFYYGKTHFLNISDTITQINTPIRKSYKNFKDDILNYFTEKHQTNKGQINLFLSIPWINNFNFKPNGESQKNSSGFLGLSTGIEYYHSEHKFLSLNASAVMDFITPVPASISYNGEYESLSSLSIALTENHKFNRFALGYGVNYSKNNWRLENTEYDENIPNSNKPISKANYGLGLIANGYFRVTDNFFIGLNYKPTLYNINPLNKFQYEHVISFDLAWKIQLKK